MARVLERLVDKVLGLPVAEVPHPVVTGVSVPMPDGVRLAADRYRPPGGEDPMAVVLIRTPYGKGKLLGKLLGAALARRGLQVVVQDVRGTFGSEGEFRAFQQEKEDGLATAAWLREQPWCDGRLATAGMSYLGHTQWAVGPYLDPPLEAMCLGITASEFTTTFYPGGVLGLDNMLSWSSLIGTQEDRFASLPNPRRTKRIRAAMSHLPTRTADLAAIGKPVPFLADVTGHGEPGDEFWAPTDHSGGLTTLTTPTSMVTGWYDLFLPAQLRDFKALRAAGREARITIGPWSHGQPSSIGPMVADQASWLTAHLLGDRAQLRQAPVRLFLQGADRWLDFEQWPPAESTAKTVHLQSIGRLGEETAKESEPDNFTYDPADPTPSVGGPLLTGENRQRDNKSVEARPDVLVFTGEPLKANLDLIGEVSATVHVRTDLGHADVFVRICDVDGSGVSRNVTEGILRLRPGAPEADADGVVTAEVPLDPTAYRFRRGHRLRVQVTGGAFPRFARNHGTGEPAAGAVAGKPCRFEVFHDPAHPSRLSLPVFPG